MLSRLLTIVVVCVPAVAAAQADLETESEKRDGASRADEAEAAADRLEVDAPAPIRASWDTRMRGRVRAGAGAMRGGDTINPGAGGLSFLEGEFTGELQRGALSFEVPLELAHRQTFAGSSLSETRGSAELHATYRFTPRLRLTGGLGIAAARKPDWTDPFQPLATGELGTTNRYSHWDRNAIVELIARPARRQRLRIRYDYTLAVYQQDPMFDAIYDPLHLAPWDRDTHRVDAVWRLRRDRWKLRVGAEASRRQYFFLFAGDAHTGITHATSGGAPPNPLLEMVTAKPRVEADVELHESVLLSARYEFELARDTYQGYLSYTGHRPELAVTWALPREAELTARGELAFRTYGPNSYDYEMDPTHPPLTFGDRRSERGANLNLRFAMPFAPHWSAVSAASLAIRRTNYAYTINWNYANWLGWAGVEYRY